MARLPYFFLLFSGLLLCFLASSGSNFNGFISLSLFFLALKKMTLSSSQKKEPPVDIAGYLDFDRLSQTRLYLLILIFSSVQLFSLLPQILMQNSQDFPQLATTKLINWFLLERPIHFLVLSTLLIYLFRHRYLFFNLTNILTTIVLFNYFYSISIEFILEFFFQLDYYRFVLPLTDMKSMFDEYSKLLQPPESSDADLYRESVTRVLDFFADKINAFVNIFNALYLMLLIRIFRGRVWSVYSQSFQFKWMQLSHAMIWPFLLGWAVLLLDSNFWDGNRGMAFLKHALVMLSMLIGFLYFVQGIGVFSFLVNRMVQRFKHGKIGSVLLVFCVALMVLFLSYLSNLFFIILFVFTFSLGLLDQWVNYRRIE